MVPDLYRYCSLPLYCMYKSNCGVRKQETKANVDFLGVSWWVHAAHSPVEVRASLVGMKFCEGDGPKAHVPWMADLPSATIAVMLYIVYRTNFSPVSVGNDSLTHLISLPNS